MIHSEDVVMTAEEKRVYAALLQKRESLFEFAMKNFDDLEARMCFLQSLCIQILAETFGRSCDKAEFVKNMNHTTDGVIALGEAYLNDPQGQYTIGVYLKQTSGKLN